MAWFWNDLEYFGDRTALCGEGQRPLSYADLAESADAFAARLGPGRQLVMLEASNSIAAVIALVACLRAHHPVILTSKATNGQIRSTFQPNIVIDGHGGITRLSERTHSLHADLGVMLSTSGSTGAAKLVRLSYDALNANAASIADYLDLGPADVPVTTLPITYSYGLSVVTSHLLAGSRIVLTERSVVDDAFWTLFDAQQATSLAGVPYTYELLEACGFRSREFLALTKMTQAGGRMDPALREAYGKWAAKNDIRFFTMYGQTEATARMAFLPPELQKENGDCIGIAIPGGSLGIEDDSGCALPCGATGELVYRGPNVMMGYAMSPEDLILGSDGDTLRTGDLAQQTEQGLFRVVGRRSRFSKIAGLRISLDDIERTLESHAIRAVVAGSDELVAICVESEAECAQAETLINLQMSIPERSRIIFAPNAIPRLSSGKVDYPALLSIATRLKEERDETQRVTTRDSLVGVYERALSRTAVSPSDSFSTLGGDSLGYIEVSMAIEQKLGMLPDHWENLTIAQIEQLAVAAPKISKSRQIAVQSEMLIRPVAMTTIVMNHVIAAIAPGSLVYQLGWLGGALTLLMTAGYNVCRFQKGKLLSDDRLSVLTTFLGRFIAPYYVIVLGKAALWLVGGGYVAWSTFALLDTYFAQPAAENFMKYWFLEVLFQCLLFVACIFYVRRINIFAKMSGFNFGLGLFVLTYALKIGANAYVQNHASIEWITTHLNRFDIWAYAFALGWMVGEARTQWQRMLCIGLGLATSVASWGLINLHTIFLTIAMVLIFYMPTIRLPRLVARAASFWAMSTFYIYLAHGFAIRVMQAFSDATDTRMILATVVVSTLFGFGFYILWTQITLVMHQVIGRIRRSSGGGVYAGPFAGLRKASTPVPSKT